MSDPLDNLGSIWYHSEHLEVPFLQTCFLVGTFFAVSYSKPALVVWILKDFTHFENNETLKNFLNRALYMISLNKVEKREDFLHRN